MQCYDCKSVEKCDGVLLESGRSTCEHFRPRNHGEEVEMNDRNHGGARKPRPVRRSDGKEYPSIAAAARDQYKSPAPERIGKCCRGEYGCRTASTTRLP